jgi:SAM-dependent methyltransferase
MNRNRGLSGVNSYAVELGFDILLWLMDRARLHGNAFWCDACCGEGEALSDARSVLDKSEIGKNIAFVGVDLIGGVIDFRSPNIVIGDVATYDPGRPVDLITCVHGLHYIGDKVGLLEHFYSILAPGGMIACNIDFANVLVGGTPVKSWNALARSTGMKRMNATFRKHVLILHKSGVLPIRFGLKYCGAEISAEPNYTGITVINSWYEKPEN